MKDGKKSIKTELTVMNGRPSKKSWLRKVQYKFIQQWRNWFASTSFWPWFLVNSLHFDWIFYKFKVALIESRYNKYSDEQNKSIVPIVNFVNVSNHQ